MKDKIWRFLPAFIAGWMAFIVFSIFTVLELKGAILEPRHGFCVLDDGTVVVGTMDRLLLIRTDGSAYSFRIGRQGEYRIATSDGEAIQVYSPFEFIQTYDEAGNLLKTDPDRDGHAFQRRLCLTESTIRIGGKLYGFWRTFGYTRIIEDDGVGQHVRYRETALSYVSKVIVLLTAIGLVAAVSLTSIRYVRDQLIRSRSQERT